MARTLLIIFIAASLLSGQSDERLRLIRADVLENGRIKGEEVQMLSGDVHFRKGDMELITDSAIFYRDNDLVNLSGGVIMNRPDESITCDSLIFYNEIDRMDAYGNVRHQRGDQTVTCEEFIYFTEIDSGIARVNVVMIQGERQITAQTFRSVKDTGIRGGSFWADGNVVVTEGDKRIRADHMQYIDSEGVMRLNDNASVREEGRILQGDNITIIYNEDQLESIHVDGDAQAYWDLNAKISADATNLQVFTNVTTSRTMTALFVDENISSMHFEGMATSIYYVVEDSILQGVNNASGDTLSIGFDSTGTMSRLYVVGGARGVFEPERGNAKVDTTITYRAEIIDYDIPNGITFLERNARVDYRDNGLSSGKLQLTWADNMLRAEQAFGEMPTLHQPGNDPMSGDLMEFDMINERGRVFKGRTKLENGHYHGEVVHRYPGNIYYVENSKYTTCSLDNPHFYFASTRMKMMQGDKVIARPIVLYVMDVPLLGLPFAVFPNETGGRRSGWIMPSYGESKRDGQYLRGLGYFWAINDYVDFTTWLDFYDRRGLLSRNNIRYNKRYMYSGNFNINYDRQVFSSDIAEIFGENTKLQYDFVWRHRQTFDPTQSFNVNWNFTSSPDRYSQNGMTQAVRLKQQITSSASYSKRWPGSASLSVSLKENYDLIAERDHNTTTPDQLGQRKVEKSRTLPSISFSLPSKPIIKPASGMAEQWYNKFRWSLTSSMNNRQLIFWEADTINADSLIWLPEREKENLPSLQNSVRVSLQQNVFKYFSTTLSLGILDKWAPSSREALIDPATGLFAVDSSGKIIARDINEIASRQTGSLSISTQTALYGLFPVNIGNLEAIRHVIKPRVSYSYTPDFSEPILGRDMGYFQRDAAGEKFDRFAGTSLGATPRRVSQSLSFGVTNLFQSKQVIDGVDKKINLLTWQMSSGYDFNADSLKLQPIRSSFSSPVLDKLNLDITMTHNFYDSDEAGRPINKLLSLPRLTRMNASTTLKFSGGRFTPLANQAELDSAALADTLASDDIDDEEQSTYRRQIIKPRIAPGNLWEARFNLRYSLQPNLSADRRETFWANTNISVNIGGDWKVNYTARLDLLDQALVSHSLSLYREIHCWEFSFNWTPSGPGQGFIFRVNVKDADLREIKYENKGGRQSGYGI